jgi:hypothetical protein
MITYQNIARIRREVENLLLLVDELEKKGIPKYIIINTILDEPKVTSKNNERPSED